MSVPWALMLLAGMEIAGPYWNLERMVLARAPSDALLATLKAKKANMPREIVDLQQQFQAHNLLHQGVNLFYRPGPQYPETQLTNKYIVDVCCVGFN